MSTGPPLSSESRKTQEELASNYALQVALQTMKERCQQLQARLSVVEEENLQLKIDKQRHVRNESRTSPQNSGDIDKLQEQIAQLSRQKSQLTHHIFMVASENKHLWTRLSLLTEANESLGTRLNRISNALSNHTSKTEQFLKEMNNDLGNQSLDEISLKLINNLQQESREFEQQFAEISELQSFKDCDFTLTNGDTTSTSETCDINDDDDEDSHEISDDLKSCKKQLSNFLLVIKEQREVLHRSVTLLKTYAKGEEDCLVCKKHLQASEKVYHDEGVMTSLSERVEKDSIDQEVQHINESCKKVPECPIGGCGYSSMGLDELADHVLTHFPPIRIEDEFDQLCLEQPPSVV